MSHIVTGKMWLHIQTRYGMMIVGQSVSEAPIMELEMTNDQEQILEQFGLGDKTNLHDRIDEAIENLSTAVVLVNAESDEYLDVDEMDELPLRFSSAKVFAHVLRQNLCDSMSDHSDFDFDEKEFWLRVAVELGPQWVAKFRRIGAFMALVEKA